MTDIYDADPAREVTFTGPTGINADAQFRRPAVTPFLRPLPNKIKLRTTLEDFDSSAVDGAFKPRTLSANYWNSHAGLAIPHDGIDLTHQIIGVHPLGIHQEDLTCGRKWVVSQGKVEFKICRPWKHHTLLLQPAAAANAAVIVDRNVVAATENINQFFPTLDPKTKVTLGSDARAQVSRLAGQNYELSRIFWRMASLYVAKAWGEKRNIRVSSIAQLSEVHVVEIRDAGAWAPTLGMRGFNWVTYHAHTDNILGPADALSVLSLATAVAPELVADNGEPMPAILNIYPDIPHARVLFITGYGNLARDKFSSLSAAQVWDIIVDYALQCGDVAHLMEMIETISGMIYAPTSDVIAPFYANRVHIGLPPAEMEPCLLLPLSTKSLAYGESSVYVEAPHIKQHIFDATCTNMALALAIKQVAFIAGFGFSFYRQHTTAREKVAMMHAKLAVTPIVAAGERILNAIGIDGTVGRSLMHMSYNPQSFEEVWDWYDDSRALLWEEALPLIDKVPYNCSVLAKLKPLAVSGGQIAVDHWYGVGAVPDAMSSVDAVNSMALLKGVEFGWQVELPSHSSVRWYPETRSTMIDGKPSDWNHCERALVDDFVVSTVFKFTSLMSIAQSKVVQPILAGMNWFVGQSSERPLPSLVLPRRLYGPTHWPGPVPDPYPPNVPAPPAPGGGGPMGAPPHPPRPPPSPPHSTGSHDDYWDEDKGARETKDHSEPTSGTVHDTGRPTVRGNAPEVQAATGKGVPPSDDYVVSPPKRGLVSDVMKLEHQRRCDVLSWLMDASEDDRVKGLCSTILKLYAKQHEVQLPDEALTPDLSADICQFIRDVNWTPTFWRIKPSMRCGAAKNLTRVLGDLVPQMKTTALQAEFQRLKHHMEARASALALNPALSVGEIQFELESAAKDKHAAACRAAVAGQRPEPTYVGPAPNLMSALDQFDKLPREQRMAAIEKMMMSGRTAIDLIARAAPARSTNQSNPDLMKRALEQADAARKRAEAEEFTGLVEMFVGMISSDNDCEGDPSTMREMLTGSLGVEDLPPALEEALSGWKTRWDAHHHQGQSVVDDWTKLAKDDAAVDPGIPPPNPALDSASDPNADTLAGDSAGLRPRDVLAPIHTAIPPGSAAPQIGGVDSRAADFGDSGSRSGPSQSARQPGQPTPGDAGSPPIAASVPTGGSTQPTPSGTESRTGPAPTLDFRTG